MAVGVAAPALCWRLYDLTVAGRDRAAPVARGRTTTQRSGYAAASIVPGICACRAVTIYTNRKILMKNAPALPVPGCDEQGCRCKYQRHSDRRNNQDRRSGVRATSFSEFAEASDQRKSNDRRKVRTAQQPRAYFNDFNA